MKLHLPMICLAAAVAVSAQTAPKPSSAGTTAQPSAAGTAKPAGAGAAGFPGVYKVPADEKRSAAMQKTVFTITLKYQDIKIGGGPVGESGKLWHVNYKAWRAADGVVFDQSSEHRQPVMGKDGKPEMGPDGKPRLGDPQPMTFPQGMGRMVPGFDDGVSGMRVGGKRRIFIPWQLAFGTRSVPDRPDRPGIPAKSDLIFDVELVDVTELPPPPQRPAAPAGGSANPQAKPAAPPPSQQQPAPPSPPPSAPPQPN